MHLITYSFVIFSLDNCNKVTQYQNIMTNQFPDGNATVQTLIDYWTGKCTTSTNTCRSQFQDNAMVASLNYNYYIKAAASSGSYRHACMLDGKYTI